MLNTITLPNATQLNIPKKQLPFERSFKQCQPCERVEQLWNTVVELEDGRLLSVSYTDAGKLVGAYTLN
jgi:hypothetical protein